MIGSRGSSAARRVALSVRRALVTLEARGIGGSYLLPWPGCRWAPAARGRQGVGSIAGQGARSVAATAGAADATEDRRPAPRRALERTGAAPADGPPGRRRDRPRRDRPRVGQAPVADPGGPPTGIERRLEHPATNGAVAGRLIEPEPAARAAALRAAADVPPGSPVAPLAAAATGRAEVEVADDLAGGDPHGRGPRTAVTRSGPWRASSSSRRAISSTRTQPPGASSTLRVRSVRSRQRRQDPDQRPDSRPA